MLGGVELLVEELEVVVVGAVFGLMWKVGIIS